MRVPCLFFKVRQTGAYGSARDVRIPGYAFALAPLSGFRRFRRRCGDDIRRKHFRAPLRAFARAALATVAVGPIRGNAARAFDLGLPARGSRAAAYLHRVACPV